MTRSRLSLVFLLFCVVCVLGHRTVSAQQVQFRNVEYDLKAGYFAYFGQFITWPNPPFNGADKAFVIGVLGDNPFGMHLVATQNGYTISTAKFKTSRIQGKKISVVQYKSVADFQKNFSPCHVLFICRTGVEGETAQDRVNAALKKTKGQPVLLVAEAESMKDSHKLAVSGVMISYWNNFQTTQVHMFINRTAEKRERLTISARLLRLRLVKVL